MVNYNYYTAKGKTKRGTFKSVFRTVANKTRVERFAQHNPNTKNVKITKVKESTANKYARKAGPKKRYTSKIGRTVVRGYRLK